MIGRHGNEIVDDLLRRSICTLERHKIVSYKTDVILFSFNIQCLDKRWSLPNEIKMCRICTSNVRCGSCEIVGGATGGQFFLNNYDQFDGRCSPDGSTIIYIYNIYIYIHEYIYILYKYIYNIMYVCVITLSGSTLENTIIIMNILHMNLRPFNKKVYN